MRRLRMSISGGVCILALVVCLLTRPARAVVLGQVDTFQTSSTVGWSQGLGKVTELRLLSAQNPSFTGDAFAAAIGVDNIRATAVPEPASMACAAGVILLFTLSRYSGRGQGEGTASKPRDLATGEEPS